MWSVDSVFFLLSGLPKIEGKCAVTSGGSFNLNGNLKLDGDPLLGVEQFELK